MTKKAAQTLMKKSNYTLNTPCVAALQIRAGVPRWKLTHRHFHSETGKMLLFTLKHLENYLRIENPEWLALNTSMSMFTTILMNGLGHTRAESLNAYGLCFSSCEQQRCLLHLYRAPKKSKNRHLFKQEESPDHKPVVVYIVKNNPMSEPNANTHMLGGSPPESTAFISS